MYVCVCVCMSVCVILRHHWMDGEVTAVYIYDAQRHTLTVDQRWPGYEQTNCTCHVHFT